MRTERRSPIVNAAVVTTTAAVAVVAIALAGVGCGARTVDFGIEMSDGSVDASPPAEASTTTGPLADATTFDSSPPPFSGADSGGPAFAHHDAAVTCVTCSPPMGMCSLSSDCCYGSICIEGLCVAPEEEGCLAPGAPCQAFSTCCSARCEPTGPGGSAVCAQYCAPDTSACTKPSECCSLACNGGVCGGAICNIAGSTCQADGDCCSGQCASGRCAPLTTSCLASGELCGDSGVSCCSGSCNNDTLRCAAAEYGACLPRNSPCSISGFSTCCDNGMCTPNAIAHVPTCKAVCTQDGERCAEDTDCCSKTCNTSSGLCGAPACVSQP